MAERQPPQRAAEPSVTVVDPAQQSLSDALRVSFWVLRFMMIALVIVYLFFSGTYQVAEQEAAVVTRFGHIVGSDDGTQVKGPGFYFGPPFPIQEIVKVQIAEQNVDLSRSFMYEPAATAAAETGRPLNPERDGSLITGDANIVHARFNTTYRVANPVSFIQNVGDMERARELVVNMVEQGIVHSVAAVAADEVIGGRFAADQARAVAQRELDLLDSGIQINNITISRPEMPVMVRDAYDLVSQAEEQRGTLINDAERDRTRLLGEAAGKAALPMQGGDGPLVRMIKDYEIATAVQDTERLAALGDRLREVFRDLTMEVEGEPFDIGGETAGIINQALIAKSNIIQSIRTEAETVLKLKERYEDDPVLFQQLMWQSAARDIFTPGSGIELFYAPGETSLYLEMNRDPQITRMKERARLEAQPGE